MKTMKGGFFWGVLLGAAATAAVGAMALVKSFKTSGDGGASWKQPSRRKGNSPRKRSPGGSRR